MSRVIPVRRAAATLLVAALTVMGPLQGPASANGIATPATPAVGPALPAGSLQARSTGQTGYWLGAADGGVYAFGATNLGQLRGRALNRPIVATVATPNGGGYWLVASDGGVFTFGGARYFGSTGSIALNRPIVGMASTPTGGGYWLVASDGGIFSFGDARYFGSTGSIALNRPIVGMAAASTGGGYWLVASDGGIFSFGDARFHGSTGGFRLNRPIAGMAATSTGGGYWLVASDGGIFSYGDATFYGSTGSIALNRPIVAMAAAPHSGGYWLVASDGGLFAYGSAPYLGSTGARPGPSPVVAMAVTATATVYPAGAVGTDVSFPQCGSALPAGGNPVSIVGVNGGLSNRVNPCFARQADNAGSNLTVYLNTDQVQTDQPQALNGPKGVCPPSDLICTGYNWGWNNATSSMSFVHSAGYQPQVWWLDVEAPCGSSAPLWRCGADGQASNAAVIGGAIDAVHAQGLVVGVYSTYYQWPTITGGSPGADAVRYPGLPIWIATVPGSDAQWHADCQAGTVAYSPGGGGLNFASGTPWLIQWLGGYGSPTEPYDGDLACGV